MSFHDGTESNSNLFFLKNLLLLLINYSEGPIHCNTRGGGGGGGGGGERAIE